MQLNELRVRLVQLTCERRAISDQLSALRSRGNELSEIAEQANTALATHTYHWQEEAELKAKRDGAKHERAKLAKEIQAAEINERALAERERDCQKDLAHAEYMNTTAAEVETEMKTAISEIRQTDAQLAKLENERAGLEAKREQAKRGSNAVYSAEAELADARDKMEQHKAQSFIAGRDLDLAPYSARTAKAEKRLIEDKRNAEAGLAALPLIAERLDTLGKDVDKARKARENANRRYWLARSRLSEIEYLQQVEALIETVTTLRALDSKTGRRLGYHLFEALRDGVRIPNSANNDYPQPLKLSGSDIGAALNRLECELDKG